MFNAAGWRYFKFNADDLANDFRGAVRRVSAALHGQIKRRPPYRGGQTGGLGTVSDRATRSAGASRLALQVAADEGLDLFTGEVVVELLRRGLHEVARGGEPRAADAASRPILAARMASMITPAELGES